MTSTTIVPSRTRRHLLSMLIAFVVLAGGLVGAASQPAEALPTWRNVHVANGVTSTKITFDATTYSDIYVIVGTGLDPTATQVARKVLPRRADQHYTTTIKGLQPKTGYSLRLASPLLSPYTDITSIVTKPAPLVFSHVQETTQFVASTVSFDYPGSGPVTLTYAKTLDFTHFAKKFVLDPPAIGHHWVKTVDHLDANTGYAFQLTAPGAPAFTDISSVETRKRSVTLQYESVKVVGDGDGWPYGCGDFAFTHREISAETNPYYYETMDSGVCLDDGDTYTLTGTNLADRVVEDVRGDSFRTSLFAWDDDRKLIDQDCGPIFLDDTCGDVGYGEARLDLSTAGPHPFVLHSFGAVNSVDVWAYGTYTVLYS